jgi:chemotaxis protein methyltransferase CheR
MDLGRIATLVQERTGLIFPENRFVIIEAGVRRAMTAARITNLDRYARALERDSVLLDDLFAELTVGETYFFREPAQLQYIQTQVLPHFRSLGRGVRLWSAGCATGEEPYTLSMMLHEAELARDASVMGTDLSRARLRVAQRGKYRNWSMRGVPDSAVQQYFTVKDGNYQLSASVTAPVEFRYLNLCADQFPSPALGVWGVDLILCRNVLIYFDEESIVRVATKLLDTLTEDGWLFLGASDPMLAELVPCEVVITSAGLAYKRRQGSQNGVMHVSAGTAWLDPIDDSEEPCGDIGVDVAADDAIYASAQVDLQYQPVHEVVSAPSASPDEVTPSERPEEMWIDQVRRLANLGRLREAGEACATALDQYRTSAEIIYLHAILLSEAGRHADAAAAARRALYLDRTMIVAHLALGSALRRTGDMPGAQRAFANAVTLLDGMSPEAVVPASGGEPAARLAAAARVQCSLAEQAA